ncbi:glycosyltransferase [Acholeplasma granularum]|uniref:glycosyltransferase n=1 Tax=Acholeplasma granularum TaxID=264635 RepID=UPI0004712344|nr:glycosyltransferase [Acholeplasma granularum]
MKVLQINSVCGTGSTGRIVTDLHHKLIEQGHESIVAFGRGDAKNIDVKKTIKIGNSISTALHLIKSRIFDSHGLGSKISTFNFIRKIKKEKFDVIHLHNVHGYYLNIIILFKFLSKFKGKVIWTFHDAWPFTGHSAYFDYPPITSWRDGIHDCIGKSNYPKSIFLDRRIRNGKIKKKYFSSVDSMTIVTPSNWLKELASKSFFNKYEIKVINNGINLSSYNYNNNDDDLNKSKNRRILLGVASPWSKRKGLEVFLELNKLISEKYQILLIGLSKKQIKKIPDNIIALRKTNNIQELVSLYNKAFIYINPTFEDNFPTTNIESISCGTPVITFNTGGSPEIIDQSCGVITKEKNAESILESIRIIENMDYEIVQKNSIMRAQKLYSKDDRFADYIRLYE